MLKLFTYWINSLNIQSLESFSMTFGARIEMLICKYHTTAGLLEISKINKILPYISMCMANFSLIPL